MDNKRNVGGEKEKETSLSDAFRKAQEEAVTNGTSVMTLDEIDAIIADVRRKKQEKKNKT